MALKKQTVSFPLAQGLTQKTSDKSSKPGTLENCKNIQINKLGEISKRTGVSVLTPSGTDSTPFDSNYPQSGARLSSLNDKILMADGERLYSTVYDQKFKDAGALLATEFESSIIHEANEEKVGPVGFRRISTTHYNYDVYTWTQTTPFGPLLGFNPEYKSFVMIKEAGTDTVVLEPTLIHSYSRETAYGSAFDANLSFVTTNPQIQVIYIDDTDHLYFFFRDAIGSTNIKFKYIDLSSSTPTFSLSSAANITTSVCASVGTFTVAQYGSERQIYLAFYSGQTAAPNNPGNLLLYRYTNAGASTWTFNTVNNITNNVFASTDSQRVDLNKYTSCRVNIALRVIDEDGSNRRVFIAYSVANSGKSSSNDYQTFIDFYDGNLGSSFYAGSGVPDGRAITINGRHCILNAGTAEKREGSGSTAKYDVVLEMASDQGGSINDTLNNTTPSRHSAGSAYKEGLVTVDPFLSALPGGPAAFGATPAVVGVSVTSGGIDAAAVDIIHAGNNISTSSSPNFNLMRQDGSNNDAELNVTAVNAASVLIRPDHGIHYQEIDANALGGSSKNFTKADFLFWGASLSTDLMEHTFGGGANLGYFGVSKTVGNSSEASGNFYISNTSGEIVASHLMGQQSLNFTNEIKSRMGAGFSLMGPISRVYSDNDEFIFGSNQLLGDIDVSPDVSSTFGIASDQQFAGTTFSFKKRPLRKIPSVEASKKTLFGGGALFCYDGASVYENNFFEAPRVRNLTTVNNLPGLGTGTFTYAFVYSSIDEAGDIHESATFTSDPIEISSGTKAICGQIYITDCTRRSLTSSGPARPQLDIYRNESNGSVFFKIQSISFGEDEDYITFVDNFSNVIDKEKILYTTGGIPDNFPTGSVSDLIRYKGRIIASSVSGNNIALCSQPMRQGESVRFPLISPFRIEIQDETERITGIEKMPDFLTVFTKDNAYAVFGDGPNAAGAGGFTLPKNIAPGQGMVDGAPHLSTSLGLLYCSQRGIYMIMPNTQIRYLGAQVEDDYSSTPLSMVLDDDINEVRVLFANSKVLIYNTFFNLWYRWDIAHASSAATKLVDQRIINGAYYVLQGNGTVLGEAKASYQDQHYTSSTQTVNYDMELEIHSISANGLQGAQRVYRAQLLGDYKSPHTLTMTVFNDYVSSATETHTSAISSDSDPYLFRAHLTNQRNRAISMKVAITNASGEAVVLNGLAFEIGRRPDTFKLPAAQSI